MEIITFTQISDMAHLYLIPNLLSDSPWQQALPAFNAELMAGLRFFIVEDVRNARRFLRKVVPGIDIDNLTFMELNKHTTSLQKSGYLKPLLEGNDIGIISEAGCPGVADPGADIVRLAHDKGIGVVPLVGPSSILLALMASGMNGQSFAFSGYLPVKPAERQRRILQLEKLARGQNQAQIFMETPYRNQHMLNDILKSCMPDTRLCIAADITSPEQMIATKTIAQWSRQKPELEKKPVIFILGQ